MANNITLNAGSGGSAVTTLDLSSFSAYPSTGELAASCIYVGPVVGSAPTPLSTANPLPAKITDGTNFLPTMDAVGRPGFQKITDGTNTMPTMDNVARAGIVKITNGTQTMPTMDAAARPGFVTITDATNVMPTMDAAARAGFVKVTNGTQTMPSMDAVARPGFITITDGTNSMSTQDVAARAGFQKITDGTNTMPTMDAIGRAGFHKLTNGTNTAGVGVGTELYISSGGNATAAVAAGTTAADQVIKASAGRLCKIVVTALGTAALSFYDNATVSTGLILFTIPASAAVGTIYSVDFVTANGIVAGKVNNSPAVTVSYY